MFTSIGDFVTLKTKTVILPVRCEMKNNKYQFIITFIMYKNI